ncbi:FadR/GntR family transcriptional regulator [Tabrizicola aquatica]|jgi:DNA-binding FadR family transcriptional regulator|uniref:FadR/GntR family transcriptional regulator n=1 Tax=Tabrizicola aquatica TaxID=909926 RepID=UPI000CD07988|nr:FCD domain-containing protein [Tabrizicola aquatica]
MRDQTSEVLDPVARLRGFILDGGYAGGAKLPPERDLSDQLGLSRATLRKALDALERDGMIWRHVGKGTFVSGDLPKSAPSSAMVELGRQLTPFRMMRARLAIEPAIAREAAVNASGEAMHKMQRAIERAKAATTWNEYEVQDDLFHRAIAEASDNLLLLALFDQLNEVRRAVVWGSVTRQSTKPSPDHSSFAEHDAIAAAIASRDPGAAYDAMRRHLGSVANRLFGEV